LNNGCLVPANLAYARIALAACLPAYPGAKLSELVKPRF